MSDTGYSADNDDLYGDGDSAPGGRTPVGGLQQNGHLKEQDRPLLPVTRPPAIVVRLITGTSSKIALPLGEALVMSTSARGRYITAFNSGYLHIIDVRSLPDKKVRAFEVSRRPVAADIHDDGTLMAVLSTKHVVNVYDIKIGPAPRLVRTIQLELPAEAVTLDRTGHLLAVCGPNSVDVYSLHPDAGDATRRCATAGLELDHVEFSHNSKWLLATTKNISRGTLVVSVPLFAEDPRHPTAEELRQVWTAEMLEPKLSSKLQSACLWQHDGMVEVVGTVDASTNLVVATAPEDNLTTIARCKLEKTSKLRELGIRDFPVVTTTQDGQLIASLTNRICVRVLQIPNNIAASDIKVNIEETYDIPEMDENTTPGLKFVQDKASRRLLILSPAIPDISRFCNVDESFSDDEDTAEGGRFIVLDFDKSSQPGLEDEHVTLVLDTGNARVLPEQQLDLKTEVALERRRTLTQKKHQSLPTISSPRRSHTSGDVRRRSHHHHNRNHVPSSAPPVPALPDDDLPIEAMEEPYTPSQPRSRASLVRAASVSQSSPYVRQRLRARPTAPVEYRRADGSDRRLARDPPHESDADNWVPPPPMYTAEPNAPLPLRYWELAGLRGSETSSPAPGASEENLRPSSATGSYAAPRTQPHGFLGIPPLASEMGTWSGRVGTQQQMNLNMIRRRPVPGGVGIGRMDTIRSISSPSSGGASAPIVARSSTAPSVVPLALAPPNAAVPPEPSNPSASANPANPTNPSSPPERSSPTRTRDTPISPQTPATIPHTPIQSRQTPLPQASQPSRAPRTPSHISTARPTFQPTTPYTTASWATTPSPNPSHPAVRPLTPYEETRARIPSRAPSRAKRSAAANVAGAKRKGLLGLKGRKGREGVGRGGGGSGGGGGGKCVVM
ncbi:hypothetical protein EV356DRAFT_530977 [Viridothelium virens]|uniref:DUF7165 domain-containing protein n=1 Tax=Viridothelium virens TaxID=1048519 RepID=A0A6A6HEH0_VIRVR|nr:hypothetical protein EV356DRAFT_530977 [Viridothelium virens]